ncbi:hypothetical protein ACQ4M3_38380 [Leptolyngbya sp. AN03gr2]|uniref:hypothetical protein n=1 Tax=unclassified Leptolyngbya TaxID=2650499 RepID=UPI003D31D990
MFAEFVRSLAPHPRSLSTILRSKGVGGAISVFVTEIAFYTGNTFGTYCRGFTKMVQVVINPASLLETGIRVERVDRFSLFRFTDELQSRLEQLLDKNKTGELTPEELDELTGIQELDRIFTYLNSRLMSEQ